jgi:hypothetical protein
MHVQEDLDKFNKMCEPSTIMDTPKTGIRELDGNDSNKHFESLRSQQQQINKILNINKE